ncbi:hypothetical protein [Brachybacterium sp. 107]|uniref:hypothetical protein n=1 Tax=Brachybacterium sp. 107 TaxID=3457736 RepID=UPI0040346455
MTSTPVHHPADDDSTVHPEDQGDARAQGDDAPDLVDDETKKLSEAEAEQHEDAPSAQATDAEESGGYGH